MRTSFHATALDQFVFVAAMAVAVASTMAVVLLDFAEDPLVVLIGDHVSSLPKNLPVYVHSH